MDTVPDLADFVRAHARERPDRPALLEPGTGARVTWEELDDQVDRVAAGLAEYGVLGSRRVLLAVSNRIEFVVAYLAALRAQAIACPVHPGLAAPDFVRLIGATGPAVVVGDPGSLAALRSAAATAERRPVVVAIGAPAERGEVGYDALLKHDPAPMPVLRDPERLAVLLVTADSAGRTRLAMLTVRALRASIEQVAVLDPPAFTSDDVVLGVLPMSHGYGLNTVLGAVLRQGSTLVLAEHGTAAEVLELIASSGVDTAPVAPAVLEPWLADPGLRERLTGVRAVFSGTTQIDPDVLSAFVDRTGIRLHQGYGLTEAAPVVTTTWGLPATTSLGLPVPGVELRLDDPTGNDGLGEIRLRGANLFSGYWPDGVGGPDADGWWSTGDLGYLDTDGYLVLVDRLAEIVTVAGFPVHPAEVEHVIARIPGVRGCAVVEGPDGTLAAYVVSPGSDPEQVIAAVHDRARQDLAEFKRPALVEVVDELPRTPTGRVLRAAVRRAGRASAEDPAAPPRVRLYTRAGCHLCEVALEVIASVCLELDEDFDLIDIDDHPDLAARYDEEVPVTFVDGQEHSYWRVDPDQLRAALTG